MRFALSVPTRKQQMEQLRRDRATAPVAFDGDRADGALSEAAVGEGAAFSFFFSGFAPISLRRRG